ncbi:ORF35 [black bullhead herpesvirus]|uniref:ORF35 n=1 Tax=black bullhead herpesvirus TaxID=508441 RepID=A0A2H5AJH2_9VIRU|nr:ORF35 [black bullhead herpesvirus]AUG72288.1 ORF35 [black bullhead herpesvirus]
MVDNSLSGTMELLSRWKELNESFLEKKLTSISNASQRIQKLQSENRGRIAALKASLEGDREFWTDKIAALGYKVAKQKVSVESDNADGRAQAHMEIVRTKRGPLGIFEITDTNRLTCSSEILDLIGERGAAGTCPMCQQAIPVGLETHVYKELISTGQVAQKTTSGTWHAQGISDDVDCLLPRKALSRDRNTTLVAAIKQFKSLQTDHTTLESIIEAFAVKAHKILSICE